MRAAALLAAVILCSGCRASPTESSSSASSSATSSADTQSLAQASASGFVSGGGPWSGGVPGTSGLSQSPGVPGSGGPSSNEDGNDDDDDDGGSPGSDLRRAFLLSQLGHHHNRRICIPEIVAFSLLPKGDSAGLFKGALGMWPFHHLNSHKLQELLYLTALSKLLPQQQQAFPFHDDKISNPLAKIQHPTLLKLPTVPVKL